ncbi:protein-disulfide reductase DsbD family protein [Rubinisphaera margarita]|uniref:protein-disulfide reductase DsbD family protein n=1 Tax=Rubinisphaera margarita TaxID=2909586 RepID=UPI001EE90181|nr:cytochrome c biogenesis protein CcdA [Rubinisphaera margarita]MCG6158555.1 thioredoxin family protein [Rubinisphaera margarita]
MMNIGRYSGLLVLTAVLAVFAVGSTSTSAQFEGLNNNLALPGLGSPTAQEPKVVVRFSPQKAVAGEQIKVEIEVKTDKESYVYSQNPNIGAETKIKLDEIVGLEPLDAGFKPNKEPKVVVEPLFDDAKLEKFFGGVVWSRTFRVKGDVAPQVKGEVRFQVCDDATCNQFVEAISLQAELASGTAPEKPATPMVKTDPPQVPKVPESIFKPRKPETLGTITGILLDSQKVTPDLKTDGVTPVTFDVKLLNTSAPEDSVRTVVLAITANMEGHWHIYAQTQDPEMFGIPTEFTVPTTPGLTPIDSRFLPTSKPTITRPEPDIEQQYFEKTVTWQRRYQLDPATFKGPLNGSIKFQLCDDQGCLPPRTVEFSLGNRTKSGDIAAASPVQTPDKTASNAGPIEEDVPAQKKGLIPFLITGVIFGYLALLTPCVFPMIPITVSFFLKQAEKEHHRPIGMALLYCLGIIGTFTFIGVLVSALYGGSAMTGLANNAWFNIFLSAVLIFFGLSMLGLFEIRMPSWLLTWSSKKESQGGVIGVLFMAFTFTLVSFTCTFAFVGGLLPMAAQGEYYWPILGMIAFSAAFSSPFFFLALFPSYLKKLPKSGGWMNNVKVTFGLLEIGAAFKFLSVADTSIFSAPYIFDYSLVMTAWMVLSIVTGLYLLGMFRLPHDTATDSIGVLRLSFALIFLSFAGYLSAGIYGAQKPEGALWEQIAAFAPPTLDSVNDVDLGPALEHDELLYALDVDQAIQFAKSKGQPLFFDFTGVNCVNCRFMEANVFPKEENRELLEKFVRVQLFVDVIPNMAGLEQGDEILDKNQRLQSDWFNDTSMPAYAIVTPDGETILSTYKGKERAPGQFTRFLKTGLEAWQQIASSGTPVRR